jgi:hypothetical protein
VTAHDRRTEIGHSFLQRNFMRETLLRFNREPNDGRDKSSFPLHSRGNVQLNSDIGSFMKYESRNGKFQLGHAYERFERRAVCG